MMQFSIMDDGLTVKAECDCGDAYFIRFLNLQGTPCALHNVSLDDYQPTEEELRRWTA